MSNTKPAADTIAIPRTTSRLGRSLKETRKLPPMTMLEMIVKGIQ